MIRKVFAEGDAVRDAGLTTPTDITRMDNISYGPYEQWNLLDVYYQNGVSSCQPTIVSIHGGGYVYGDKDLYQYYCMNLAQRGFTVVNFSYRLAPEQPFPAQLEDINQVFTWIAANAQDYNIDLKNLFIVGDSAGAQLSSQYMAMLTNQEFQKLYDFTVPSEQIHIQAAALNCGMYDMVAFGAASEEGILPAYLGGDVKGKLPFVDTMRYVTNAYPPCYVMTSYYDFLKECAKPMYEYLTNLGIPCEYKLYGTEEQKEMAHVFHLNIRMPEATECNDAECEFFKRFLK